MIEIWLYLWVGEVEGEIVEERIDNWEWWEFWS